jgi:SIR2-like domain
MDDTFGHHFVAVIPAIEAGLAVPTLGAGVNLADRGLRAEWEPDADVLPTGLQLFRHLANRFDYPGEDFDLARLTQYVELLAGRTVLYDELHRVFDKDYPPTVVHRFFADLPRRMREKGHDYHQLVVTMNYDDCMERAFQAVGEPFDVVWYAADPPNRGKFLHRLHSGVVGVIEESKVYRDIEPEKRSIVLKLHGTVDRFDRGNDSYVITIDDYLEYLTRADVATLLPPELVKKLYKSHFLFLGYGLRDWNLQVILRRIWGEQSLTSKSWAVLIGPDEVDRLLWDKRNVDLLDSGLDVYMNALEDRLAKR